MNEDKLLEAVTEAAKTSLSHETRLAVAITACCDAEVERAEVVEAVITAGWSEKRARSLVSQIYVGAGKRQRKAGAGRKTTPEAIKVYKYAKKIGQTRKETIALLLAAYRYSRNSASK